MPYVPRISHRRRHTSGIFGDIGNSYSALLDWQCGLISNDLLLRKQQFPAEFVSRLGFWKELQGHEGCVNCLEWNQNGSLLASGSDDCAIRIWNPFSSQSNASQVITTGHTGNIFGVKFLPDSNDKSVASCAADGTVRIHDVAHKETTHVYSCHLSRVKKITTAADSPFLIWSGAEDGLVLQYDLREPSHSAGGPCNHVLINLNPYLHGAEIKSVACNPVRSELLAVGATDCFARLFDRRKLTVRRVTYPPETDGHTMHYRFSYLTTVAANDFQLPSGCVRYFTAGHLPFRNTEMRSGWKAFNITDLRFNASGSEMLANIGGEQIYLFDVNSTDSISKVFATSAPAGFSKRNVADIPKDVQRLKEKANERYHRGDYNEAIYFYNRALSICPTSSVLYSNRAVALLKRGFDGDSYQSLLDAYTAFSLDPTNDKAQFRVIKGLAQIHRLEEAKEWLEFFRELHSESSRDLVNTEPFQKLEYDIGKALDVRKKSRARPPRHPAFFESQEQSLRDNATDFYKRFVGHCNTTTDIKEANFVGQTGDYIMAGSDDGSFFIWDRESTNLVKIIRGDRSIVNCLQYHPTSSIIATSGIDNEVRLWIPVPDPKSLEEDSHERKPEPDGVGMEVEDATQVTAANQRRMNADPWNIIIANWVMGDDRPRMTLRVPDVDPDLEGCVQQ